MPKQAPSDRIRLRLILDGHDPAFRVFDGVPMDDATARATVTSLINAGAIAHALRVSTGAPFEARSRAPQGRRGSRRQKVNMRISLGQVDPAYEYLASVPTVDCRHAALHLANFAATLLASTEARMNGPDAKAADDRLGVENQSATHVPRARSQGDNHRPNLTRQSVSSFLSAAPLDVS